MFWTTNLHQIHKGEPIKSNDNDCLSESLSLPTIINNKILTVAVR